MSDNSAPIEKTMMVTPPPLSPVATHVSPAPSGGSAHPTPPTHASNFDGFNPSIPPADLLEDWLLKTAQRVDFKGQQVPCVGGIALLTKLGQGGMGAVYFGVNPRLKQEVAVKILPFPMLSSDPDSIQRFYREAQIAAKVKNNHLVSVTDVNEEGGMFYLVMDFILGTSAGKYAKELRKSGGKVSEADALDIVIAACVGLEAAHGAGIIHRDLKPDNILLPSNKNGSYDFANAKLADLGLARSEDAGASLTGAATALGTPGFMSPEQCLDAKNARRPADVFSMGATLYDLLAGKPPFTGSTPTAAVLATVQSAHTPMTKYRDDVSPGVIKLIDKCLQKEAGRRYPDGQALLAALRIVKENGGALPMTVAVPGIPGAARVGGVMAPRAPSAPPPPDSGTAMTLPEVATRPNLKELAARGRPGTGTNVPDSETPYPSRTQSPLLPASTPAPRRVVMPTPVRSSKGKWIGLAALLMIGAAAAYFALKGPNEFEISRDKLVGNSKTALRASGDELDKTITTLDQFENANTMEHPSLLDPVNALKQQLIERRKELRTRLKNFEAMLSDAESIKTSDPRGALAKLAEAEQLGAANSEGHPDLLANLNPPMPDRKQELADVIAKTQPAATQSQTAENKSGEGNEITGFLKKMFVPTEEEKRRERLEQQTFSASPSNTYIPPAPGANDAKPRPQSGQPQMQPPPCPPQQQCPPPPPPRGGGGGGGGPPPGGGGKGGKR